MSRLMVRKKEKIASFRRSCVQGNVAHGFPFYYFRHSWRSACGAKAPHGRQAQERGRGRGWGRGLGREHGGA